MKKKILTIVLTALLLLSMTVLGVSTVFQVETVTLSARLTSNAGVTAESLQEEIATAYEKQSILSSNEKKAEKIVEKYPYLRLVSFKKSYPDKLTFTVVEESETYAVEGENGYAILNGAGVIVAMRKEANNREDKAPNLLLKGLTVTGKVGDTPTGDDAWSSMFSLCKAVDTALGSIRVNVVSAEVLMRAPQSVYLMTMREGVKIYVETPDTFTEEKGKAAIEKYLSLTDEERMKGRITVRTVAEKTVAEYKMVDEF